MKTPSVQRPRKKPLILSSRDERILRAIYGPAEGNLRHDPADPRAFMKGLVVQTAS
jgi:hypothetical protein